MGAHYTREALYSALWQNTALYTHLYPSDLLALNQICSFRALPGVETVEAVLHLFYNHMKGERCRKSELLKMVTELGTWEISVCFRADLSPEEHKL